MLQLVADVSHEACGVWAVRVGEAQRVFVDVRVGEGLVVSVFCDVVI